MQITEIITIAIKIITEASYMSSYYFFLSILPNFNRSYGSSIKQSNQLKKNDQSEFNFVVTECSSIKNKFHLLHCIQDSFTVTKIIHLIAINTFD